MEQLFKNYVEEKTNLFVTNEIDVRENQQSTNEAFSEKWSQYCKEKDSQNKAYEAQKQWFLELYGFHTESKLKSELSKCEYILDAGCGLGYKSAWFAELSPKSNIIAMDYSDAIYTAYDNYRHQFPNIIFVKGDIGNSHFPTEIFDLTVCDQVIMHTEEPSITLKELSRITKSQIGLVLCYWYRKKALPRELLDDYFRSESSNKSHKELWGLSREVMNLGKMLSHLEVEADFPDVPSLGIQGGKMDLQRFIYWNFIKCFWNEELGEATSLATNFDWYSPTNAKRFSKLEVYKDAENARLKFDYFHEEMACYSGRLVKY